MSHYLFLYGTLLPNQTPTEMADIVDQLQHVGSAHVRGRLYDLGEYPGAILDSSSDMKISGEVFEIPDKRDVLSALDSYEGYNPTYPSRSLFLRKQSSVHLADGRTLTCWIYVYNKNPGTAPLVRG